MDLFMLDNTPDINLLDAENSKNSLFHKRKVLLDGNISSAHSLDILTAQSAKPVVNDDEEEDANFYGILAPSVDISSILNRKKARSFEPPEKSTKVAETVDLDEQLSKRDVKAELSKSVISTINSSENLKKFTMPERKLAEDRKKERSKSKGDGWFNLPATELTDDIKNDLQIIQMRSALDPKHFYRKSEMKVLPKYFQIGKVLPSALDHYSNGAQNSKKQSLVDELLQDADFQKYNKLKYKKLMDNKKSKGYHKAQKKSKKLKKQKK